MKVRRRAVQESCTLLDTQSQQLCTKGGRIFFPANQLLTGGRGGGTQRTEYHGIHTDKLVSPVSVVGFLNPYIL